MAERGRGRSRRSPVTTSGQGGQRRPGRLDGGLAAGTLLGSLRLARGPARGTVADSLVRAGFAIRSQIVWVKPRMVFGRGAYHWRHEPRWYAVREGASADSAGDRTQTTVWEIDHLNFRSTATADDPWMEHATQKPLEAMS